MPTAPASRSILLGRFISFALVGGLATGLHYAVALLLMWTAALQPVTASSIGFATSAVFNYLANARVTFKADPLHAAHALRFLVATTSGCALNAAFLEGGLRLGLPLVAAQLSATLVVLLWNFTLNAAWVFKRRDAA